MNVSFRPMKPYAILYLLAGLLSVSAQTSSNPSGQPIPDCGLAWDAVTKSVAAAAGQDFARFEFSFTNVTTAAVTIQSVRPSCGCTTAELPPVPWTISAGSTGRIKVKVNLAGKFGTVFKSATVTTDKGKQMLSLSIDIGAAPNPQMSQAQRDTGVAIAKMDRQAIFKDGCASCHLKNVQASYGRLFTRRRAAFATTPIHAPRWSPTWHTLPGATNLDFWRTWISSGKPGTLMPAFASSQGGPLNEAQIDSLAFYLNSANLPRVPVTVNK